MVSRATPSKIDQVLDIIKKLRDMFLPSVHGKLAMVQIVGGIGILNPAWYVPLAYWLVSFITKEAFDNSQIEAAVKSAESGAAVTGFVLVGLGLATYFLGEYLQANKPKPQAFIYLEDTLKDKLPSLVDKNDGQWIEDFILGKAKAGDEAALQVLNNKNATLNDFINILLASRSTDRDFNYILAQLYFCNTNMEQAKECCQKELNLYQNHHEARLFLISILEHENNKTRALRELEALIPVLEETTEYKNLIHALIFHWHFDINNLESLEKAKALAIRHNCVDALARILYYLGEAVDIEQSGSEQSKFWCAIDKAQKLIEKQDYAKARLIMTPFYETAYEKKDWLAAEYVNRLMLSCYKAERDYEKVYDLLQRGLELAERSGCLPGLIANMVHLAESCINRDDPDPQRFDPEKALSIWRSLHNLGQLTDDSELIRLAEYHLDWIGGALAELEKQQALQDRINKLRELIPQPTDKRFLKEFIGIFSYGMSTVSSLFIRMGEKQATLKLYKKLNELRNSLGDTEYNIKAFEILWEAGTDNATPQLIEQEEALAILESLISKKMKEEAVQTRKFFNNVTLNLSPLALMQVLTLDLPENDMNQLTDWLNRSEKNLDVAGGLLVASWLGHCDALPKQLAKILIEELTVDDV